MVSFSISGLSAQRSFRRSRSCSVAVLIIALAIALTACSPQAPQRPSQRSGQQTEPDSMTLAMVELHQRLADAADVELNNYIRNHPGQWLAQEDGSWYSPSPSGDSRSYSAAVAQRSGLIFHLRLVTRDLEGNLLSDVQGEYELGKCQLPEAVENVITTQLSTTAEGTTTLNFKLSTLNFKIAAPWYVAYGSKGNDAVPQYQNVIIEVYIL